MKYTDLPYPGSMHGGIHLRREAAKAIHAVERAANASGGMNATSTAQTLGNFFEAAASLARSVKGDSVGPRLRRIYCYAEQKSSIILEFDRELDPRKVPASGLVFAPAKTLTGASIIGNKMIVMVSTNVAAGYTVAYTQPGSADIQDKGGVKAANFTATAGSII